MFNFLRAIFVPVRYRKRHPSATELLGLGVIPGHRVTLRRRRLLRSPLVLQTQSHASHAEALAALKALCLTSTGQPYTVKPGDLLTHHIHAKTRS